MVCVEDGEKYSFLSSEKCLNMVKLYEDYNNIQDDILKIKHKRKKRFCLCKFIPQHFR